ncbi:hypothetical protein [Streptomyces sp. enrichment culture]|uniref:hypothetical protein n=1 Tax=Streptomyces sp. enrichment culture TaxID=1795815 RepID=UPI003F544DF4
MDPLIYDPRAYEVESFWVPGWTAPRYRVRCDHGPSFTTREAAEDRRQELLAARQR